MADENKKFPRPKRGKPLKWTSPEQVWNDAMGYFEKTPPELYTITGLALYLGTNRDTLWRYGKKDEYSDTIRRLKTLVEESYELLLKNKGTAGSIFALKNFGWRDQTYIDSTIDQKVAHSVSLPTELDELINPIKPKSRT